MQTYINYFDRKVKLPDENPLPRSNAKSPIRGNVAGKFIPWQVVTLSLDGKIIDS